MTGLKMRHRRYLVVSAGSTDDCHNIAIEVSTAAGWLMPTAMDEAGLRFCAVAAAVRIALEKGLCCK
jgi:hypothetical protein